MPTDLARTQLLSASLYPSSASAPAPAANTSGIVVARPRTPKLSDHDAQVLEPEILQLTTKHGNVLVVDLSEVLLMGSTGLGMLINLRKKLGALNGKLALAAMNDDLFNVMKITKLTGMFTFHANVEEAVKSLQSK
jgi:anti-sigma B factor antagonist